MAIKPPTKLSAKWWSSNVPKSLPTSKIIEAELKKAEKITAKDATDQVNKQLGEGVDLAKIKTNITKVVPNYTELAAELKKFQVLANKDKDSHKEFVAGIDVLLDLAKKQSDEIVPAMKQAYTNSDSPKPYKTPPNVERFTNLLDKEFSQKAKRIAAVVKSINQSVSSLADQEGLERAIGRNRFLQTEVKTLSDKITKLMDKLKADLLDLDDSEIRLRGIGIANSLNAERKNAVETDKLLVLKAVEVLGDKAGKKLFLNAAPVTVSL
jgi:hypothetical protein